MVLIPENAHRKLVYPTRERTFPPWHFWLFSGSKVTPAPPIRDLNFSGKLQTPAASLNIFQSLNIFAPFFPLHPLENQASNTSYFPSSLAARWKMRKFSTGQMFTKWNARSSFAWDWDAKKCIKLQCWFFPVCVCVCPGAILIMHLERIIFPEKFCSNKREPAWCVETWKLWKNLLLQSAECYALGSMCPQSLIIDSVLISVIEGLRAFNEMLCKTKLVSWK